MAILQAGNIDLEINFHKFYADQTGTDYSFQLRVGGHPFINPLVNKDEYRDGTYSYWNCWNDDILISTLEDLLLQKKAIRWNLWPETNITLTAETWESTREERMKRWEGKTTMVKGEDGITRTEPYSVVGEWLEPVMEQYFDIYVTFENSFFIGYNNNWENFEVRFKLNLSYVTLEVFLNELKAEYEFFKLQILPEDRRN